MYRTGQTIYTHVLSFDEYNQPISGATFSSKLLRNLSDYTGVTLTSTLLDANTGIFNFYFTPLEFGAYQIYCKNNTTNTLFMSEIFQVVEDDYLVESEIYVGI